MSLRGLHCGSIEVEVNVGSLVESSDLVTKTESCLSTTDQVHWQGTVAKVCQALTHTKSCERIDEAWTLSCP